jgi:DNA-binding GntR family transcriptional regulator
LSQDLIPSAALEHRSRQIAETLRNDILSGRMVEGLRLTESELAQRFGVGRGLVREAVQQLSMQGLLITRPNRGAAVAPEAPREIRQLIIPIRRTVEAYALQSVFDELTDADFRRWEEVLLKMKAAGEQNDFFAVAEADIAFHRVLLERAGQPDLLVIWDALVGRIRSHFRRMQRRYSNLIEVYDEHAALLEGYRRGDLDAAVRLLKANIE